MPPQPHPPVAEGAWLRPRPARQSPDCRRGRVHRQSSRRPKRVRLKAAAFPAQHIRSALSQGVAVGSAYRRLRRIPAGRRVRMRRDLPSPGSVGIPPVAGWAASRLPPSVPPAVTAPAAERSDAKCAGPGSDRTRTQSDDCRAGRTQCGTVHFAREYRWGGGPRTLTGTPHHVHTASHTAALWRSVREEITTKPRHAKRIFSRTRHRSYRGARSACRAQSFHGAPCRTSHNGPRS